MQRLQPINVGQQANDRTGDRLRDGMVKVNENFIKVETAVDKVEAAAAGAQQRADAATRVGANVAAATADGKRWQRRSRQPLAWLLRRRPTARPSRPRPRPTKPTGRRSPPMRRRQRRRSPPLPAWRQPARPTGRRLPPMRPPWSRTARRSRPRKPPPWPRPPPMRPIKGANEDSAFLRGHAVGRGHAGRPACDAGRCADSTCHDGYRMGRRQLERTAQACPQ